MRKILLAITVSLMIVPSLTFAEGQTKGWASKPIQCDNPVNVLNILKKYGEQPIIGGMGLVPMPNGQFQNMPIIWFFNKEKDTWTLVEWNMPTQACILASGSASKFNFDDLPFLEDLLKQLGTES